MNKEDLNTIFKDSECLSEEKLIAYCNNELTNLERNEVERHTINCKFCSDALEGFEAKIHSEKGYYSAKAEILKKQKNKKTFFITISGIAAACIAFILLTNELKQTQTEVAENIIETAKPKTKKSKPYQLKSESENSNASRQLNIKNDLNVDGELNQNTKTSSDSNITFNKNHNGFMEESKEKLLDVNTGEKELNSVFYEPEIEFKKENQNEKSLNKSFIISDKTIEDDQVKGDNDLFIEEDLEIQENSYNTVYQIDKPQKNNIADLKESTVYKSKKEIRLNYMSKDKSIQDTLPSTSLHSNSLNENKEFQLGISAFKKESYTEAISILKNIDPDDTYYYEAQLYIGKSHIKLGNSKKSKTYLKNALNGSKRIQSEAQKLLSTQK